MTVDALCAHLETHRPDFLPTVEQMRLFPYEDPMRTRGMLAQLYVQTWLNASGVSLQERRKCHPGYKWIPQRSGVVVYHRNVPLHEFDFVCNAQTPEPFAVEVKSLDLNGFSHAVQRGAQLLERRFNKPVPYLLIAPFYGPKKDSARQIEEGNPTLRCIHIGYTKEELEKALKIIFARGQSLM